MSKWLLLLALILGVLPYSSALAKAKKREVPASALNGHLVWRDCIIPEFQQHISADLKLSSDVWPIACLRPRISSQVFFRDDTGEQNLGMNLAELYHGIHLNRVVSLHGMYIRHRVYDMAGQTENVVLRDDTKTEELYLQLGNVALHRFRAAIGHFEVPFGVNHKVPLEISRIYLKNHNYWKAPRWGVRLAYDTLVSSQFELAYQTDVLSDNTKVERGEDKSSNEAVSMRAMFDIAALEGFRSVVSGYGESKGARQAGLGFITKTRKGDEAVFEWVRRRPVPSRQQGFEQLFRLSYIGPFQSGIRGVFEFESEAYKYRSVMLGADFILPDYGLYRLHAAYVSGWEKDQDSYLVITSAIQLAL